MDLKYTICALALTAGLSAAATTAGAEIRLRMSHFVPTTIGLHTDFMEPWARRLEACSGGEVTVEIHPAGSALGDINQQYDQARAGVVDIAFGHTGFPAGRFPRSGLIELPFLVPSSDAGSHAMWDARDLLAPEYQGVHVLGYMTHNPGVLHSREPLTSLEGLAGMRVRTSNAANAAVVQHFGGESIGLPPGQIYEALQRGTIDAVSMDWNGMNVYRLYEVATHHLDVPVYVSGFFFVMNQARYDSLPDNVRACVDQDSGEALVSTFGAMWNAWQEPGLDIVNNNPEHVVTHATPEEVAAWRDQSAGITDTLIENAIAGGVENAREIVAAMEASIAAHN
ncbi:MAG: TRAP transporter substrate-binding protein [Rhodobacter sp.]|nr:TRAP transporter substrate-binding protein [Paracoccaceae bacterium]MCC0076297.1 TRAP transporter substrate-binding protein [Rhodobacter sp.]